MTSKEKLLRAAEAFISMKTSIRTLGSEIDELDKSLLPLTWRVEYQRLEKQAREMHPEIWTSTERIPTAVVDDLVDFFEMVWSLGQINDVVQCYPEHRKELVARWGRVTGDWSEEDIERAYYHLQWWLRGHDSIPTFNRLKKDCHWGPFEKDGVKYKGYDPADVKKYNRVDL